jgi:hypothetical protein
VNKYKKNVIFKYVFILLVFFLLIFIINIILLPKQLYKDKPVDAEIMIVEGWLPGYAFKMAIKEFHSGKYELMVTTGNDMSDEFMMGSGGNLIFDLNWLKSKYNNKKTSSIRVNAFGTKADRQFPYFNILLNDTIIGGNFVRRKKNEYKYIIDIYLYQIDKIKIDFINDTYTRWKDRNLIISSIVIEDIEIPARSHCVFYDINNLKNFTEYEPRFINYADYSAFCLRYLGHNDSIVALPVLNSNINRTYSCAQSFNKWYLSSSFKGKPVNIVSLGPHSRRTWMTYRRVLGKNADVGIIMVNNEKYNKNNWWKSLYGIKATIHEMASYIYTLVTLPFLRKELKE